jgi:DNA-binding transcriptional LysR family regulator
VKISILFVEKVFQSVAKNLSFTKASQELFITQPAITKHIHELEIAYQTRLFDRQGGKISLTDSGKLLLEHTERILDAYKRLEYEMHLLNNNYAGELRLGASTTIAQYVLPPLLASFIDKFPQVHLSLMNGNSREIETALQEHRIDLGLVEGVIRQPNLKYSTFLSDELVAVTRGRGKLLLTEEIMPEELLNIPLVLRERGSGTLDVFEKALQERDMKLSSLRVLMYLGSTESIKLFLEHTECMGIVSIRSVSNELYAGKLRVVEIKGMPMLREFSFVQLQGQEIGLSQEFIQFASLHNQKL